MTKYIIVKTNRGYEALERFVNEAMANGYYPVGGPLELGGDGCMWLGQAMVLR